MLQRKERGCARPCRRLQQVRNKEGPPTSSAKPLVFQMIWLDLTPAPGNGNAVIRESAAWMLSWPLLEQADRSGQGAVDDEPREVEQAHPGTFGGVPQPRLDVAAVEVEVGRDEADGQVYVVPLRDLHRSNGCAQPRPEGQVGVRDGLAGRGTAECGERRDEAVERTR